MTVPVLDNYDSFTWNLVQTLEALSATCLVRRSDRIDVKGVAALRPDRIVLSPGPFGPERTGVCPDVVRALSPEAPILGVCLGMQVIAAVAGAAVGPSGRPVHGKASPVTHDGQGVFAGLPSPFLAARYPRLVPGRMRHHGGLGSPGGVLRVRRQGRGISQGAQS
jgi:anthranilate synthase/aminodeoxychorismate synthase-like glutamine amidotransferase